MEEHDDEVEEDEEENEREVKCRRRRQTVELDNYHNSTQHCDICQLMSCETGRKISEIEIKLFAWKNHYLALTRIARGVVHVGSRTHFQKFFSSKFRDCSFPISETLYLDQSTLFTLYVIGV